MVKCRACATVFTTSVPEDDGEAEDYTAYYQERNLEIPAFIERRLEEVVDGFGSYRRDGRWLDIGCGAGALVRAASGRGWSAVGTELAPNAVERLRDEGFEAYLGETTELPLEDASFDVVSLVEVVEHVPEPVELVREAARLVRPGGAVYVTTPHGRGVSARLLGTRWSNVAPPEHLVLVSARGMRAIFERAHLRTRRITTEAVNPHELRDVLLKRESATGCARVEDAYALNEALSASRRGRLLKDAVNRVLAQSRLGDAMKAVAERPL